MVDVIALLNIAGGVAMGRGSGRVEKIRTEQLSDVPLDANEAGREEASLCPRPEWRLSLRTGERRGLWSREVV